MNTVHPLVTTVNKQIDHLRDKINRFAISKTTYNTTEAVTSCSTYQIISFMQAYKIDADDIVSLFGSKWPRARAFQWAYSKSAQPTIDKIKPGTLGAIGYKEDREGMSGHCFIVMASPVATGAMWGKNREFKVRVADSCRSSHGEGDTRYRFGASGPLHLGGIGIGTMRLLADEAGNVVGHSWSVSIESEVVYNGDGLELAFANVPSTWSARK